MFERDFSSLEVFLHDTKTHNTLRLHSCHGITALLRFVYIGVRAKATSFPDGFTENSIYSAIHQAVACCRPEHSAETIPAGSSHSQPMDIFLFHWNGTSQSWETMRPAAWLIVLEMFTLSSDKKFAFAFAFAHCK